MSDNDGAMHAYKNALRHNPQSTEALEHVAAIACQNEDLPKVKFQSTLDPFSMPQ